LHGGQQQAHQQGNDGYDDEQFDQREGPPVATPSLTAAPAGWKKGTIHSARHGCTRLSWLPLVTLSEKTGGFQSKIWSRARLSRRERRQSLFERVAGQSRAGVSSILVRLRDFRGDIRMATVPESPVVRPEGLELHTGDRMTREEFHRIYQQMPEDFEAELIGGTVYVGSPLKRKHGTNHLPLGTLFFAYEGTTPGVESGDNTTILLGEKGEPQPDLYLRVLPEFGGQSRTTR